MKRLERIVRVCAFSFMVFLYSFLILKHNGPAHWEEEMKTIPLFFYPFFPVCLAAGYALHSLLQSLMVKEEVERRMKEDGVTIAVFLGAVFTFYLIVQEGIVYTLIPWLKLFKWHQIPLWIPLFIANSALMTKGYYHLYCQTKHVQTKEANV